MGNVCCWWRKEEGMEKRQRIGLRSSRGGASGAGRGGGRWTGGDASRPDALSEARYGVRDASPGDSSVHVARSRAEPRESGAGDGPMARFISTEGPRRGPDRRAGDVACRAVGLRRVTEGRRTLLGSAILTFVSVVGTCDVREVLWKQGCEKQRRLSAGSLRQRMVREWLVSSLRFFLFHLSFEMTESHHGHSERRSGDVDPDSRRGQARARQAHGARGRRAQAGGFRRFGRADPVGRRSHRDGAGAEIVVHEVRHEAVHGWRGAVTRRCDGRIRVGLDSRDDGPMAGGIVRGTVGGGTAMETAEPGRALAIVNIISTILGQNRMQNQSRESPILVIDQ